MEPVTLKGNREGIVVHFNYDPGFDELCKKIEEKIKAADSFLGNKTEVIINSGSVILDEKHIQKLRDLFCSWDMGIKKFIPEIEKIEVTTEEMDFLEISEDETNFLAQGPTLMVKRNLRSGQTITHQGTVIILGDVNPGAEIIASGHIFVIGSLRGIGHAGAQGDTRAVVFASRLQPTQLRIANVITRAPDEEVLLPSEPEIARIKEGMIIIEKYLQK